jgi:hypothetical protein
MTLDLNRLREIGFSKWDPVELMRNRETWVGTKFQNEYDHYMIHVADRLIVGDNEAELVAYLVEVERDQIGLGTADCSKTRAAATVAAIKAHVNEALPASSPASHGIKALVEARFPGWRVVEDGDRLEKVTPLRSEAVMPDIETLKAKWIGQVTTAPEELDVTRLTGQVVIEPIGGGGPGRKTVIVRNGKIIGAQG